MDPRDGRNESFHGGQTRLFSLNVGHAEIGLWRVRVYNKADATPHFYEQFMLFLPSNHIQDMQMPKGYDLLQGTWKLDRIVSKKDLLFTEELQDNHDVGESIEQTYNVNQNNSNNVEVKVLTICQDTPKQICNCSLASSTLLEWLLCGGGVLTLFLGSYFIFCIAQSNSLAIRRKRALLKILAILIIATLIQVALCAYSLS